MPRDSNGNASTDPVYVATPGTTIRAVQHNTPIADIIQMLTGSLARNGSGGMLADLAMGGFKITGLANGTSAQDAVTKAQLDATLGGLPQLGAWTNVASASTVDLGAQTSRNIVITGNTTITSFGAAGAADNVPYLLRFSGVLTLTHGTDLILPGGANIKTAAGDMAVVVHDDANTWRVVSYARATTAPSLSQSDWNAGTGTTEAPISPAKLAGALATLAGGTTIAGAVAMFASGNYTPSNGTRFILAIVVGGGGGSGGKRGDSQWGSGGRGGCGGVGFALLTVTPGVSYPVVVGAAGAGGAPGSNPGVGQAGGTSSLTVGGSVYVATGGAGGQPSPDPSEGPPGADGSISGPFLFGGHVDMYGSPRIIAGGAYGYPGFGYSPSYSGVAGNQGCLLIVEFGS